MDMMFHIQPWMLVGLFPLAFFFEVLPLMHNSASSVPLPGHDFAGLWQTIHLIIIGSLLAFFMEFSEYLLLSFTSSLTLSMAGIFKEIFTLYLAVNFNGDQMSRTNFLGLVICLFGIATHVFLKACDSHSSMFQYNNANLLLTKTNSIHSGAEIHSIPRAIKSEEIEAKRLLDDEVIHFDIQSNGTTLMHGVKNI